MPESDFFCEVCGLYVGRVFLMTECLWLRTPSCECPGCGMEYDEIGRPILK